MTLRQRQPALKSNKLRQSARGQDCALCIPWICDRTPETTVLCHISFEGGTMGGKAPDWSAVFGCANCHNAIDERSKNLKAEEREFYIRRALQRTWDVWWRTGLIKL